MAARKTASPRPSATPQPVDVAGDAVSQHVGFLLGRAHQRFRQGVVEALADTGLNPGQMAILGALFAAHGLSQRELGVVTGIEKSSMVLLVDSLEAAGWVKRRPHASDRRAHALEITARGVKQLQVVGPRLQAMEAALMASFSAEQRRHLLGLLQKFVDER